MKARSTVLTVLTVLLFLFATTSVLATWEEGVAAYESGRYDEATQIFASFVERSPQAAAGHYMLGMTLARQKQVDAAVDALARAIELDPANVQYKLVKAKVELNDQRASDAWRTLQTQDPRVVPAKLRGAFQQLLAKSAVDLAAAPGSLAVLRRAIDADPSAKQLWIATANIAKKLDRYEDAFSASVTAFELDPGDAELGRLTVATAFDLAERAAGETRREWYEKGLDLARQLATTSPSAANLRLAGDAAMGAQRYAEATDLFGQAITENDADPWPHFDLGRCLLAQGEAEKALGHLEAAAARQPDARLGREISNAKGSALRHLERFTEAAEVYAQAGNSAKANEMRQLVKRKQQNEEWDIERARCERKRDEIAKLRVENEAYRGTAAWDELEAMAAEIMAVCTPYLSTTVAEVSR